LLARIFIAAVALSLVLLPAQADTLLADLSGNWTGRGWAKQSLEAPKEAVFCRIRNALSKDKNELKTTGRCAVANKTFTLDGLIAVSASSNRVTGRWRIPRGGGDAAISGRKDANQISFTFEAKETSTKQKLEHRAKWSLRGAVLTLTASASPPSNGSFVDLSSVQFKK